MLDQAGSSTPCSGAAMAEEIDEAEVAKAGGRCVRRGCFVLHSGGTSFQGEREALMAASAEILEAFILNTWCLLEKFVAEDLQSIAWWLISNWRGNGWACRASHRIMAGRAEPRATA